MTARKGTNAFHGVQSKYAEDMHVLWVREMIADYNLSFEADERFWICYKLPVTQWIKPTDNTYAWLKNGMPQTINPDGGFIMYKDNPIGVCEHKHQEKRPNACERAFKYLTIFKPHQIFVSTTGPGFVCEDGGGSTGPMLEMAMYCGMTVCENADRTEFRETFRSWLECLI